MNFLTKKLAGLNKIDLVVLGLISPPKNKDLCSYFLGCEHSFALKSKYKNSATYDFCSVFYSKNCEFYKEKPKSDKPALKKEEEKPKEKRRCALEPY